MQSNVLAIITFAPNHALRIAEVINRMEWGNKNNATPLNLLVDNWDDALKTLLMETDSASCEIPLQTIAFCRGRKLCQSRPKRPHARRFTKPPNQEKNHLHVIQMLEIPITFIFNV